MSRTDYARPMRTGQNNTPRGATLRSADYYQHPQSVQPVQATRKPRYTVRGVLGFTVVVVLIIAVYSAAGSL